MHHTLDTYLASRERLMFFVILLIYTGLISGRLDQRNEILRAWAPMPRDVHIDEVSEMIATLSRYFCSLY